MRTTYGAFCWQVNSSFASLKCAGANECKGAQHWAAPATGGGPMLSKSDCWCTAELAKVGEFGMFSDPDFESVDPSEFALPNPFGQQQPVAGPTGGSPAADPKSTQGAFISELYAAAWAQAQRDYELDRLFNAEFYQGGEI